MNMRLLNGLGVGAVALAAAGCASTPPAAPVLAAGAASLDSARAAGANEYAAAQLEMARGKLERARALAQTGRDREALMLAQQADVDAQLARALAGSERSARAVSEIENGLRTLREELNRAAPGTAAPGPTPRPAP